MRLFEQPTIHRNMTPIVGKILWARNLTTRIRRPMDVFVQHPDMLRTPTGMAIVREFNRMNKVLLEFEMIYHMAWLKSIHAVSEGN